MKSWKEPIRRIQSGLAPVRVSNTFELPPKPASPWKLAHSYAPLNCNIWNANNAKQWYLNIWKPKIPQCGQCRKHWTELEQQYPPDFSSPKAFFEWFWARHNDVSRLHANKPTITLDEAYKMYWPNSIKWYVAVTTAPRKECTLLHTLDSLERCGWEPVVFAEPNSTPTTRLTYHNNERLGVWRNWIQSVRVALESDADVIMTVQDDCDFHPESKSFTESIMWPAAHCGFVSLYTPKHYSIYSARVLKEVRRKDPNATQFRPVGVNRIYTQSLWGACTLVWPRKVLEQVARHSLIEKWVGAVPRSGNPAVYKKRMENPSMIANSDTAIGKIMNHMNKSMWFVDPSLVTHTAKYSSISHGSNDGRRNAYRIADHTIPLSSQLPLSNTRVDI